MKSDAITKKMYNSRLICRLSIVTILGAFSLLLVYDHLGSQTLTTFYSINAIQDENNKPYNGAKLPKPIKEELVDNQINVIEVKGDNESLKNEGEETQPEENIQRTTKPKNKETAYNEFLLQQQLRKSKIDEVCRTPSTRTYQQSRIIVDRKDRVVYCPNYKVASTSITDMLNEMQGNVDAPSLFSLEALRKYFIVDFISQTSVDKYKNYKKFMVVRHPLERVLSAYRDKFEKPWVNPWYYKTYGETMVRNYRKVENSLSSAERFRMLAAVKKKIMDKETVSNISGNVYGQPVGATFEEFVKYVSNHPTQDEHWKPFYVQCKPCQLKYNYILRFESLAEDASHMLRSLNRGDIRLDMKGANPSGKTNPLLCSYLADINPKDFEKLVEAYRNDFLLYGYDYEPYVDCLKKGATDIHKR